MHLAIGGRPVWELEDVRFYRDWVENLIARGEKNRRFANEQRKPEVDTLCRKALAWYQAAEAGN